MRAYQALYEQHKEATRSWLHMHYRLLLLLSSLATVLGIVALAIFPNGDIGRVGSDGEDIFDSGKVGPLLLLLPWLTLALALVPTLTLVLCLTPFPILSLTLSLALSLSLSLTLSRSARSDGVGTSARRCSRSASPPLARPCCATRPRPTAP